MSVTYGFYNSNNHDRRYNTIQMSSIFDGIILDGIFMSIGTCFVVEATGNDMFVRVGEGRAWFNHTWTLNDSLLPLEVPLSEVILNRIDAVVLEVNEERSVRANSIKIVKGTPSSNPVRPTMIQTKLVHQYPLAFIRVNKGVTSIRQADLTNMVGSGSTPYVTGILKTVNIEAMVAQWEDQWKIWLAQRDNQFDTTIADWETELNKKDQEFQATIDAWEAELDRKDQEFDDNLTQWTDEFDQWVKEKAAEMMTMETEWNNTWFEWFNQYVGTNTEAFNTWFENLQAMLEPDVAANLANEILKLQKRSEKLEKFRNDLYKDHRIYDPLMDSNSDPIQDTLGNDIFDTGVLFLTDKDTTYPNTHDKYYQYLEETYLLNDLCIKRNSIYRGEKIEHLTDKNIEGIRKGNPIGLYIGDYFTYDIPKINSSGIAVIARFNYPYYISPVDISKNTYDSAIIDFVFLEQTRPLISYSNVQNEDATYFSKTNIYKEIYDVRAPYIPKELFRRGFTPVHVTFYRYERATVATVLDRSFIRAPNTNELCSASNTVMWEREVLAETFPLFNPLFSSYKKNIIQKVIPCNNMGFYTIEEAYRENSFLHVLYGRIIRGSMVSGMHNGQYLDKNNQVCPIVTATA